MSLLTVAQDVCDVIGLSRPAAIVSGSDQLARQALGLAKETLEQLGRMDWPVLEIPYTFNTVIGQAQYNLPSDFGREVGNTVYAASQYSAVRGSLTPAEWASQQDTLRPQLGKYRFRIFGLPLTLNLTQTPQVVEAITLEYQTAYRVRQLDNTYKTTFFADSDVTIFPEELLKMGLKWRLRRAKGLDYTEEFNEYEWQRAQYLAQALQLGSMQVSNRGGDEYAQLTSGYIPENGFGS